MPERLSSDPIPVVITTVLDGTIRAHDAHFLWPEGQPVDTYHILLNDLLDIEFDSHLPVRPTRMRWLSTLVEGEVIQPSLAETLMPKQAMGMLATSIVLNPETRLQIAQLQANDLDTPELLRQVCSAIVARNLEPAILKQI